MAEEKKAVNEFVCDTCNQSVPMDHDAFMKHLHEVHSIKKGAIGTRTFLSHIDGTYYYEWVYRWEINRVTFTQHTVGIRGANDLMRHA